MTVIAGSSIYCVRIHRFYYLVRIRSKNEFSYRCYSLWITFFNCICFHCDLQQFNPSASADKVCGKYIAILVILWFQTQTFLQLEIKFSSKDLNLDIAVSAVPGVTRQLRILGPYTTLKPWVGERTPHSQLQGDCLLPNAYRFQTNLPQHRVE